MARQRRQSIPEWGCTMTTIEKPALIDHCRNNPVKPQNIPEFLKGLSTWVVWKAFVTKDDGRFNKVPISAQTGHKVNHLDKAHQMSFQAALSAYQGGLGDGVGISLNSEPVTHTEAGKPLYLIGVDLDKVAGSEQTKRTAKNICQSIRSYCGIRVLALSEELLGKGQSISGEMYHKGKFLTMTGHGPARDIAIATDTLKSIERDWWPENANTTAAHSLRQILQASYPDTPRRRAELKEMLNHLTADCDYERYRDIVWAILSTNWYNAEEIARNWCQSAPERFEQNNFETIVKNYDPHRANKITIGSLVFWAREAGWHG
jgi:primase-polymerase (primpol)-like protein